MFQLSIEVLPKPVEGLLILQTNILLLAVPWVNFVVIYSNTSPPIDQLTWPDVGQTN